MKVLAIDPGYERLGLSVLQKDPETQKEVLLYSECFKTSKDFPHSQRLFLIFEKVSQVICEFSPDFLAIETLFFGKNHKTALLVAEACGTILVAAKKSGLEIAEFKPNEIKLAVTGYGKSDKQAIYKLVPQLIKISKKIRSDDEIDSIAIGLTFFAQYKTLAKKN